MTSPRFVPDERPKFVPELLRTGSSLVPPYYVGGTNPAVRPSGSSPRWS